MHGLPRTFPVVVGLPLVALALSAAAAGSAHPAATPATVAGHRVSGGAAAGYVDDAVCATCHDDLARSYLSVGMSRSFARPDQAAVVEDFRDSRFFHAASGRWYEMERRGDDVFFHRWTEDDTGRREPLLELARGYLLVRDFSAADGTLASALRLSPGHPRALGWKAVAQINLGRWRAGLDLLRRAWEADPADAEAAYNLGLAHLTFGNPADAVPTLHRAVELRPTLARAWSRLGDTQQVLGQRPEALVSYARALAVEPADIRTREARDRLLATDSGEARPPAAEGRE